MKIREKIEKHIEEEKQLSEYKIQLLKTGESKQYKERLILKEEDFISFDFLKIPFSSLEEVREAILMFKTSREDFDLKYGDSKKKSLEKISQQDLDILNQKFLFFEEKYKWILNKKIKEINIVENQAIRLLLKNPKQDLSNLDYSQIKKIEGSTIGKYRARIQILLYCLARYFFSEIKKIKKETESLPEISYNDLKIINLNLSLLFSNYKKYYYQYFNLAKIELPSLLIGTIGDNSHIQSIHSLKNISTEIESFKIKKITDKSTLLYDKSGSKIDKKSAERSYGISTGIKRVGSESIDVLYIDIHTESGINITRFLDRSFFNNYYKGDYIKSISTIPIWEILSIQDDMDVKKVFSSFYKNDGVTPDVEKINKGLVDSIDLSVKNSIIFVAETRSDSDHLKDVEKTIDLLINIILKEYQEKFNNYFSLDLLEEESRKINLKKFLEK